MSQGFKFGVLVALLVLAYMLYKCNAPYAAVYTVFVTGYMTKDWLDGMPWKDDSDVSPKV
jgi:hypothetical protein